MSSGSDEEVRVAGGQFSMGSSSGAANQQPVHVVTLAPFYIMATEVTFSDYDEFCDDTDRTKPTDKGWGRGDRPVINVTWEDAVAYANGTHYQKDACCYTVAGVGFEAYEVWRDALARGLPDTSSIGANANQLKINRQHAAIFLLRLCQRVVQVVKRARDAVSQHHDLRLEQRWLPIAHGLR